MKIRKIFLLLLFIFISCNQEEPSSIFHQEAKIIDTEKIQITKINGVKIIDEVLGAFDIDCTPENIVLRVEETPENKGLLQIYTKLGDLKATIVRKGQGPNDVLNARFVKLKKVSPNIWINDVSARSVKLLDIPKSLSEQSGYFAKTIKLKNFSVNCFPLNETTLIAENSRNNNYWLTFLNPTNDSIIFTKQLYPISSKYFSSLYQTLWVVNEEKNCMVGAMQTLNQVNFIPLSNYQESFSITVGAPTNIEEALDKSGVGKYVYYCDIDYTANYVFALKLNQSDADAYEKEQPITIEVFNWEGKLIRILSIDEYLLDIAIDDKNNILYGLDMNGSVYSYKLKDF